MSSSTGSVPGFSESAPLGFPATRRTLVVALGDADPAVRTPAFDALIGAYWKPVYKYLRVTRRIDHEDAEDLTQDFFANAFDRDTLSRYDQTKARFRTFLRVCLDHFVISAHRAANRLKRGGGTRALSLDWSAVESEVTEDARLSGLDPDAYFRREWIRTLFEQALADTEAGCRARGKDRPFAVFRAADVDPLGDDDRPSYHALATRFDLPVTQVTNYLALVRRIFRQAVLDRIRAVAGSDADFAAEVRDVLGIEVE